MILVQQSVVLHQHCPLSCCTKQTNKIISRKYFVLFFLLVTTDSQDFPPQGENFKQMLDFVDSMNDSESDQRTLIDMEQMTEEKVRLLCHS